RLQEKIARDNRPLDLRLDLGTIETISGRPAALTELMTNLILNALDAMPEGGTLTVATRNEPGRHIELTVTDTGIGMPEAVRRRIFEPFFTTKPEGEVTGLGLSMVYSIVRRHAGEIRVESEPTGGEVAERVRRVDETVPSLRVRGWGLRDEDHGRLKTLKIRKCLFKPVRPVELDAAIQEALVAF